MLFKMKLFVSVNVLALAALQCKSASDTKPAPTAAHPNSTTSSAAHPTASSSGSVAKATPVSMHPATTPSTTASSTTPKPGVTAASTKPLDDAQIAALTEEAHSAEIEQGKLAQSMAHDARVKAFARMMVENHAEAQREEQKLKLAKADKSSAERASKEDQSALQSLKQKSGSAFDRAYVQLQIDEHQKALDSIKKVWLPDAHDSTLKSYLQKLEPKVEAHLKRAEALEKELASSASPPAKASSGKS
jgi:putative membrane protein